VEGKSTLLMRDKDQTCPFLCIKRSDIDVFPGIINFRTQPLDEKDKQDEKDKKIFVFFQNAFLSKITGFLMSNLRQNGFEINWFHRKTYPDFFYTYLKPALYTV
jgi:hypothetical protein